MKKIIYIFTILLLISNPISAEEQSPKFNHTNLEIPRFVSLGSNKINLRTGPGKRYPIEWVFKKKGMPVEIIQEFDTWRKIKDKEGNTGWAHKNLISGKRTGILIDEYIILKKPIHDAKPIARVEKGVIVSLENCKLNWCKVEISGYKGWIERTKIWGVYPKEKI